MSDKSINVLIRVFLVLYVALCVGAVVVSECKCCADNADTCTEQSTIDQPTNAMTETRAMAATTAAPTCSILWLGPLKEGGNPKNPADYPVVEEMPIDASVLAEILDDKYYMGKPSGVVMARFIPQMILKYKDGDKEMQLMYSFTNGEVAVYADGEASGMKYLYNPQALTKVIDSLKQ